MVAEKTPFEKDYSKLTGITHGIDWLTGPIMRIVDLSFADHKMDEIVHLKLYLSLSGRSRHQF